MTTDHGEGSGLARMRNGPQIEGKSSSNGLIWRLVVTLHERDLKGNSGYGSMGYD